MWAHISRRNLASSMNPRSTQSQAQATCVLHLHCQHSEQCPTPVTCSSPAIPHHDQDTDWLLSSLFCCHIENISYLKDKIFHKYYTLRRWWSREAGVSSLHTHTQVGNRHTTLQVHEHTWQTFLTAKLSELFLQESMEIKCSLPISQGCWEVWLR